MCFALKEHVLKKKCLTLKFTLFEIILYSLYLFVEDDQDIYLERILDDEAREDPKNMTSRVDCVFEQLVSIYQDQQKTKEVVDILAGM